jgi:hypothetical protein
MTSRSFGLTVRDFSKTKAGRDFLTSKFKFEAFPQPNFPALPENKELSSNLLGATFDYLLRLLIESRNTNYKFEAPLNKECKPARAVKEYYKNGILNDALLDSLISLGEKRQRSFASSTNGNNLAASTALKNELRRIHELAQKLDWRIKTLFQVGWLASGGCMAAQPDLILDCNLYEVKSTKDASHHDEHLAQVFSYYLMTQAPIQKRSQLVLNKIGIYYARHGALVKNKISEAIRFPLIHLKRVAFDFMVEFQYYRDRVHSFQKSDNFPKAELEARQRFSFNDVLKQIHPKPAWLEKSLKERFQYTQDGVAEQRIKIPQNFLID